ncbi:MAG: L-threonylcarbamoyladenylate synthase [Patescibacteria group bacterium]|jgi:tRNA threonylcarbamoyl adenosine modification protein (Sua5/YciO/YrdC/YwlC family)
MFKRGKEGEVGGIVVYPTDTAYAIGCDFRNKTAIKKIMAIKGRKDPKFTLIAASLYQAERFFKLNSCQKKLAKKYWPGPLSIVVSKKYAVRVPNNTIAKQLAKRAGAPLIATSFNKSGEPEIYNLKNKKYIKNIFYINMGKLKKCQPSTVVECKRNKIIVHRQGEIYPPLFPSPNRGGMSGGQGEVA